MQSFDNTCKVTNGSKHKLPFAGRLLTAWLLLLVLAGCDNALQKNEANFSTEIENVVINLGGTVVINNVPHTVKADSKVFCPDAPIPRLKVGGQARQVDPDSDASSLRLNPGIRSGVRAAVRTGDHVSVLFGPMCSDGYNWFVVAAGNFNVGWVAEAGKDGRTYWFEPVAS